MRKLFIHISCAVLALSCISCDQIIDDHLLDVPLVIPEDLSAYTPEFDSQKSSTKSPVLYEYQPESWNGPSNVDTRTYAVIDAAYPSEYFQYWAESDAISVFFTTSNLKYELSGFKDEDGDGAQEDDYGIFNLVDDSVSGTALKTEYYIGVYPYRSNTSINYETGEITYNFPMTQHYNGDSYSNGENGMIALEKKTDEDGKWYFQNFCCYLQLRLYTDSEHPKLVKQIILASNNQDDKISGDASIKVIGDGSSYAPTVEMKMATSNQLILDCGSGVELSQDADNPSKFWFVLPGDFTFTEGFNITVSFDDNSYFNKSTSKQITIERNHIKPMAAFTTIEEEDEDLIVTEPIRYKYRDTSITEAYPLKNSFYDEEGNALQIISQTYDETTGEWLVYLSGTLKTIGSNSFETLEPEIEYIIIDNDDATPLVVNDFAFYSCAADYIQINNNVESVNGNSFKYASTTSLYIDGDVTTLKTNLGASSFLEEIIITGNVTNIEQQAFLSCSDLMTVSFNSVERIGYQAFYRCNNLSDIDLSTVKYIEEGAFLDCSRLQTISLDSVITIGDNAFMGCSRLTSVVISEYCTMIGEGAFCDDPRLREVTCYAVVPPFIKTDNTDGSYVFNKANNLVIYIPEGSYSYYTDPNYFVNNPADYEAPVQTTVNWWYQEYVGRLRDMM